MKAWIVLLLCLAVQAARADALTDKFNTVWESLWFQDGSPTEVIRWPGDILVRVHGVDRSTHRQRIIKGLEIVAAAAGRKIVDISDAPDAESRAGIDVQIVRERDLDDNMPCHVSFSRVEGALIQKLALKMRTNLVYHCVLHESMHAMGIPGHPSGDTVLSYFYQRVDAITDMDRSMLATWYSDDMKPGMTPLEALVVLTDAVVKGHGGNPASGKEAQRIFLLNTVQSMEAFAGDKGEIPVILKRSGRASGEGMKQGRLSMRYFLGMAYVKGTIVATDVDRAIPWFERAARGGLAQAQYLMGILFEQGLGVAASAHEAYFWYGVSAAREVAQANLAMTRVAAKLTPEEIEQVKVKISAFK